MGVKVNDRGLDRLLSPSLLMGRISTVMRETLEEARHEMVESIETRGTGRTWTKPWSGGTGRGASIPGRDDTGGMKGDVIGEVVESNAKRVRGVLGWPEGSPEYYSLQEDGFYNWLSRENVAPMRALRDASENATDKLVAAIINMTGK